MKSLIVFCFLGVVGFFIFVRFLEATSVFHPSQAMTGTPADIGLRFDDVTFKSRDGLKLHAWWIPHSQAKATILYFHGNAGNISDRLDKIRLFSTLNVNVFILDYRGYGLSQGFPTEAGLYADAQAAYTYLLDVLKIPAPMIVVYGASLGGAVAIDLAARQEIGALIVDSSFTSAKDMAQRIYPMIPSWMMQIKWDSTAKIKFVTKPKLFFHSREDDVVPWELGQKLFEVSGPLKTFIELKGTHNDTTVVSEVLWKKSVETFIHDHIS